MAFHINPKTGNASRCRAKEGNCPFGSADEHYSTLQEATKAWEAKMGDLSLAGEKKVLVLADIDGTIVKSSLVLANAVALHDSKRADLGEHPARWLADMKNELLIRELAEEYRAALAGRTVAFVRVKKSIEALFASQENFYSTLEKLVEHKKNGDEVVLISGSPDFLVAPFAKRFGFKYHASTYHKDERGRFTGEITLMAGAEAKKAVIADLHIENYDRIVGIGDTASDLPLLEVAHERILVNPTAETLAAFARSNISVDEIIES